MSNLRILFTGGGSGGHLQPAVSVITHLLARHADRLKPADLAYIGSQGGIESREIPRLGIPYHAIPTGKLRRYFSLENFKDFFRVPAGIWHAWRLLGALSPSVVFSTGGYVALPVVLAARLRGIPVVIHEQTIAVGLANRISARFARKILISFPESEAYFPPGSCQLTGLPVRESLFGGSRASLLKRFGFVDEPILYVTGGANGSKKINDLLAAILPDLLPRLQVLHQCGKAADFDFLCDLKRARAAMPRELQGRYVPAEFFREELPDILNGADLLLGRSGAGTVYESLRLKLPALYVPLPGTTLDEQLKNARYAEKLGAARVLEEKGLDAATLSRTLLELVAPEKLFDMKRAAGGLEFPDALGAIASILLAFLDGSNG